MASETELERMKARAEQTEKILADLQVRVAAIKQAAVKEAGLVEEEKLLKENAELRKEIESIKRALIMAEISNGGK
ncbi:aminoacyl tRNA synthase complex-interacting multifunctional protein 1-like [Elysia marginata]|uniref:Aminoacyl tRNA synthase complex-interacting multifunctional protein 1-like n=1 Tax=Elysia marginata TaxID=1093978 RepID=A0AAV4IRV3_9GAST|nr:aminoacyl tRNA synthase complex-interacting multifunctional protein 1-like [Elysia marginata]